MKVFILMSLLLSTGAFAKEINVKVQGMVCSMCAQGIKKKFSAIESVEKINVNLDQKIVTINTKQDLDVDDAEIQKIIKEAGYNVAGIERK